MASAYTVAGGEDSSPRRSKLIEWYLQEVSEEIDSEQQLVEKKTLIEKIIYRLVHHVSTVKALITSF